METNYSIKNFRIFDSKGATLNLKPITALTGCNSSGKSSVVKSIMLLNSFLNAIKDAKDDTEPRLDFTQYPLSLLGNFDSVLNKDSAKAGDRSVTFVYEVKSALLGRDITISMEFIVDDEDIQRNGFLKDIVIKDSEGSIFFHGSTYKCLERYLKGKRGVFQDRLWWEHATKLSAFKKDFYAYWLSSAVMRVLSNADAGYQVEGNPSKEGLEKLVAEAKDYIRDLGKKTPKDTIDTVVANFDTKSFVAPNKGYYKPDSFEKALDFDLIYYLPILEKLDRIDPSTFDQEFMVVCGVDNHDEKRYGMAKRILDHYHNDGAKPFIEYYREFENSFLDDSFSLEVPSDIYYHIGESLPTYMNADGELREATPDEIAKWHEVEKNKALTFYDLFVFLCMADNEAQKYVSSFVAPQVEETTYRHIIADAFIKYREMLITDSIKSGLAQDLIYISSSRVNVQRQYEANQNSDFGRALSKYFESVRLFSKKGRNYKPGTFINKWVRKFGIGDRIEVSPIGDGIGYVLKVFESEQDKDGRLLADFGYGISQLFSILLGIESVILDIDALNEKDKGSYMPHFISESLRLKRTLPLYKELTIAIEEPEIHLHPDYQALLAEMFYEAWKNYNVHFIIETHSEYLIRRIQVLFASLEKDEKNPFTIYYFPKKGVPYEMEFTPTGQFDNTFGPGFFDAAGQDALRLSRLARQKHGQ